MAPTEERKKALDFSDVFFYPRNAIVYRSEDSYPTLDSLKGKTVAYVFGTNYQQVAEGIPGVKAVGIQVSPACIEEVKSKRADACIIDGAGATEFLKQNEGLKLSLLDKTDDCFAIGFPKNSPYYETFNATLKEMMQDGTIDKIVSNHLSPEFIL
jgi:polar amino acid transport system substrate-binding protein